MKLFRLFPATIASIAVVLGGVLPALAVHQLESPDDVDGICRYSDPQFSNASAADSGDTSSQVYQTERRAMAQKVMEVTVSAEQLAVIGYDHITSVLSISGFRDYPLFAGRHFLRFREGCALHFEMDAELARDWTARVRMGGAGLKIGFMLSAHDNYEQTFCDNDNRGVVSAGLNQESVQSDARSTDSGPLRHILLSDLLYATLIDADGKELSTYHSELGHRVYLRKASQVDGKKSASIPRVQVTSLVWTGGNSNSSEIVAEEAMTSSQPNDVGHKKLDSWWRSAIEAAAYPCYQRGLARNGSLQGAFVMRMPAIAGGKSSAEILLDTLQVDEVSSCILERVRAIRMPSSDHRRWTSMKATMLFKLD